MGRRLAYVLGVVVLAADPIGAAVVEIGPGENLQAAVNAMGPGDTLVLRGGTYSLTFRFSVQVSCTQASPCEILAKPGEVPVIHRPNADQNIVDVEFSHHLAFVGIEFTGGSRGIRIRESTFITLEGCHIHDTGDAAVTANDSGSAYEGLRFVRNHIHHTNNTGEGMYLGCNYGACEMFASVVEGNWIHDTNGPTVSQGDGIEIKEGSWGNVVRDNVIHDTGYPCILTYSTVGNGGPNVIERNLMWGCGDHAIQAAADAVIRNNLILGAAADGIRNQLHQTGTPSNLEITHNTVLAPTGNAVRSSGITGPVLIANNALYAQSGYALRVDGDLSQVTIAGNVGTGGTLGVSSGWVGTGSLATDFVAATFSGTLPQDLFPASGSDLISVAHGTWLATDDFNRRARFSPGDVGAYRFEAGGNPGWPLAAAFKPIGWIFANGFEMGHTLAWSSTVP